LFNKYIQKLSKSTFIKIFRNNQKKVYTEVKTRMCLGLGG